MSLPMNRAGENIVLTYQQVGRGKRAISLNRKKGKSSFLCSGERMVIFLMDEEGTEEQAQRN